MTEVTDEDMTGCGFRKVNGVWRTQVTVRMEPYWTSIEAMTAAAAEAVAGLDDWLISMDTEYGTYGDRDHDLLTATGWRDATDEEIAARRAKAAQRVEQRTAIEDRQIAALRASRPELFRD